LKLDFRFCLAALPGFGRLTSHPKTDVSIAWAKIAWVHLNLSSFQSKDS
jgi:hypothetical protein